MERCRVGCLPAGRGIAGKREKVGKLHCGQTWCCAYGARDVTRIFSWRFHIDRTSLPRPLACVRVCHTVMNRLADVIEFWKRSMIVRRSVGCISFSSSLPLLFLFICAVRDNLISFRCVIRWRSARRLDKPIDLPSADNFSENWSRIEGELKTYVRRLHRKSNLPIIFCDGVMARSVLKEDFPRSRGKWVSQDARVYLFRRPYYSTLILNNVSNGAASRVFNLKMLNKLIKNKAPCRGSYSSRK